MRNENGVTLATVVLTVVVMLIIASTSIFVGNRLILDAKEQKKDENIRIVLDAIKREVAKASVGGVISPGNYTYVGLKNPVIGRDSSDMPIYAGDNWYLLDSNSLKQIGVSGLKGSYIVDYEQGVAFDADDFSNNGITVTFDANGGDVDISSTIVVPGGKYSNLPIPTRNGYTFLGWNGKNKLNLAEYTANTNYYKISGDEIRITKSNSLYTSDINVNSLIANRTYTISGNITGKFTNRIYGFFGNSLYATAIYDDNKFKNTFIYSSTDDKGRLAIYQTSTNTSVITNLVTDEVVLSNIQLEEGSVATEYEPYFVTSDVKVTQTQDHTLTAIWKANT